LNRAQSNYSTSFYRSHYNIWTAQKQAQVEPYWPRCHSE